MIQGIPAIEKSDPHDHMESGMLRIAGMPDTKE
jgi:hypothetical protein